MDEYLERNFRKKISNDKLKAKYIIKLIYLLVLTIAIYTICVIPGKSFNPFLWAEPISTVFCIVMGVLAISVIRD